MINVFTAINGTATVIINKLPSFRDTQSIYVLLINVLTLVIKFTSLLLMLASPPPLPPPNEGSATVAFDQPTIYAHVSVTFEVHDCAQEFGTMGWQGEGGVPRARNRSSERIAMAFIRRTQTVW